jgi:hypothetical protein
MGEGVVLNDKHPSLKNPPLSSLDREDDIISFSKHQVEENVLSSFQKGGDKEDFSFYF